jgi:hypothetical protein
MQLVSQTAVEAVEAIPQLVSAGAPQAQGAAPTPSAFILRSSVCCC